MEAFKKQHLTDGQYTDNMGLIAIMTQHLLEVEMRIVSTSCNTAHPLTLHEFLGPGEPAAVFHVGYYQDQSHQGGHAGHYHSLREVNMVSRDVYG